MWVLNIEDDNKNIFIFWFTSGLIFLHVLIDLQWSVVSNRARKVVGGETAAT